MLEQSFLSKARVTKMIQDAVSQKRLGYIDAIVHICEENNIEIDDIKRYITPVIKEKLEAEARSLNFLPKGNTLPI